jgi:dipeptidyl-peptidase-4
VDTYSNVVAPPQQYLDAADGKRVAVLEENRVAELADYGFVAPHFYTVPGADGTPLNAMVTLPPDFAATKKYPVIVYLYGGPESQVVVNAWAGSTALWHQMMARKGFIILSVDNRGMAAHGHGFETAIYHHLGRDALADQLAALNWLKSMFPVDENRIGIWGWSFGGFMTCYAMLNAPDVFKAGFAGSPVTDWREYDTIYTERYMGRPQENQDGYRDSSPVNQAANLKGKLMITYGTGDDNVHVANTMELADQFIRAGRYAEMYPYPNRGHGASDAAARIHLFNRVTQFFLENLK